MLEGRASTGSTSATVPSSDPFSRCAIPAPTRICAQFAGTFGCSRGPGSIGRRGCLQHRVRVAYLRRHGLREDRLPGDRERPGRKPGVRRHELSGPLRSGQRLPRTPYVAQERRGVRLLAGQLHRMGVSGLHANPLHAISIDSVYRFCQRNVFARTVMATA